MAKRLFQLFVFSLILLELFALIYAIFFDIRKVQADKETNFLKVNTSWANTTLKIMSIEEKAAQLFMLKLDNVSIEDKEDLQSVIKGTRPGGISFSSTDINTQILLTNSCQSIASIPLLIGSEGSLLNQNDFNFPTGMILNACNDSVFIEQYLLHFSKILANSLVNIDFSTTINEFNENKNGHNNFSANKLKNLRNVQRINYLLKKQKILTCISQFNEFQTDSLSGDRVLYHELKKTLKDFSAVKIDSGYLSETTYDSIGKYLKNNFQFNGLIFSDIDEHISDSLLLKQFRLGVDMFVVNKSVEKYVSKIMKLISEGMLSENELDAKVRRVLLTKTWFGIHQPKFQSAEYCLQNIFTTENKQFSWEIYEKSTTLLKNKKQTLPFRELSNKRVLLFTLGDKELPILKSTLNYYLDFESAQSPDKLNIKERKYTHLILAISDVDQQLFSDIVFMKKLAGLSKTLKLIILNFDSSLMSEKLNFAHAIVQLYDKHPFSQSVAAQVVVGAVKPKGKIPNNLFSFENPAESFVTINRLKYTIPEKAGFDSYFLHKIDTIIENSAYIGASPGYQVLAVKNGKVFFNKAYGYHTYAHRRKVKTSDLFDLASITKVAATTLATMKLFEWDSIRMDDSIKYYIDDTINCTIKNHQLRNFYTHQTGLPPDMPILRYIKYKDSINDAPDKYFTEQKDSVHTIEVARNFYLRKDWRDSVIQSLYKLEYDTNKTYRYSDINLNIAYDVISRKIDKPLNEFLRGYFYKPLHLRTIGYLPLQRFNKRRLVPTQNDKYWRKQLLQGYPHDESAALYGGVAGNAGLFSNANDLAILFQMMLNGGTYAGKRLLKDKTIEYFIQPQEDSPRGLGFNRKKGGLFGHSGFTGCVVWANPNTNFIFIFLSNSIHSRSTNKKLKRYKIREQVYEAILDAQIKPVHKIILANNIQNKN